MTIYLNLRQRPSGNGVADHVVVHEITLDATNQAVVTDVQIGGSDLNAKALGKNVLLAMHGFNVAQLDGYQKLSNWSSLLQLDDTWLFIGVVWPGDSSWLGPLCYPGEGRHAIECGNLLAPFIATNLAGAQSISLVSHSLGARFLLQTVTALQRAAPSTVVVHASLMAGAINHDCLTDEYAAAANRISNISLLASVKDEVLAAAFPIGNIFEGIINASHPWFQSALGHKGPKSIPPGKTIPAYQIPSGWDFGHGSYLELAGPTVPALALPQNVPAEGTCPLFQIGHESSYSAAFVSTRLD